MLHDILYTKLPSTAIQAGNSVCRKLQEALAHGADVNTLCLPSEGLPSQYRWVSETALHAVTRANRGHFTEALTTEESNQVMIKYSRWCATDTDTPHRMALAQLLLDAGADVATEDIQGATCLHAKEMGVGLIRFLLNEVDGGIANLSLLKPDNEGRSVITHYGMRFPTTLYFIDALGVDYTMPSQDGLTLLALFSRDFNNPYAAYMRESLMFRGSGLFHRPLCPDSEKQPPACSCKCLYPVIDFTAKACAYHPKLSPTLSELLKLKPNPAAPYSHVCLAEDPFIVQEIAFLRVTKMGGPMQIDERMCQFSESSFIAAADALEALRQEALKTIETERTRLLRAAIAEQPVESSCCHC